MSEREELIAKGIIGKFDYFMEDRNEWTDIYEKAGVDYNLIPTKDNIIIEYDEAKGFRVTLFYFSDAGNFQVRDEHIALIHLN